ncbi:MAG: hypothetical protein AAF417_03190 [Pseudomonadota bacterium]
MDGAGYVIRKEHIQAAMDKATAAELRALEALLPFVNELDQLERTLPERTRKAMADAEASIPKLSKSAQDAVSQSDDARREIDRLLTRKCNRADSAVGVVKEVYAMAKLDMKEANVLDNWIADDDPTKAIYSELYWKRRALVESLRKFIAVYG